MGKIKELKITIDKIVLTITVILAVIWFVLTMMICKDLTNLQKENKQLQVEIEQKNGDINYLDKVIETREEEFNSVEVYKAEIDKLQEENNELRQEIIILQRRID